MNRRLKVPALACIILFPLCCAAQAPGSGILGGLKKARIVVDDSGPEGLRVGLNQENLRSFVFVRIKHDISQLQILDSAQPLVYLWVDPVPIKTGSGRETESYTVNIFLSVYRPAVVLDDDGTNKESRQGTVNVWQRGTVLYAPTYQVASMTRAVLENLLTELAAEYYKQNP